MVELVTIWTERKKIADERFDICKSCEHLTQHSMRCNKCGCFMRFKTLMMDQNCPIGKWSAVKPPDVQETD